MGVVQVAPNNTNYEMPKNLAIELYKQTKQRVRVILTLNNWAITTALVWIGFKPFFVFSPKVLIILNIFQIMYLIIGVYNTKTESCYHSGTH